MTAYTFMTRISLAGILFLSCTETSWSQIRNNADIYGKVHQLRTLEITPNGILSIAVTSPNDYASSPNISKYRLYIREFNKTLQEVSNHTWLNNYIDTFDSSYQIQLVPGKVYEILINAYVNSYNPTIYCLVGTGINQQLKNGITYIDQKKCLIVIDKKLCDDLGPLVENYRNDLLNEGFETQILIVENDKGLKPQDIKERIRPYHIKGLDYLFIVGDIPVAYSGFQSLDGHIDHLGAWPMDYYYADFLTPYTDKMNGELTALDPRNHNIANDGKFDITDQNLLSRNLFIENPSPIHTAYGRLNLDNMPIYQMQSDQTSPVTTLDLYKDYFQRNSDYRNGKRIFQSNAVAYDAFLDRGIQYWFNIHMMANSLTAFQSSYIPNIPFMWIYKLMSEDHMFGFGFGPASYSGIDGLSNTWNNKNFPSQGIFNFVFGSYFGDWDTKDNYLRSFNTGKGLASVASGWGTIRLHSMAYGDRIGDAVKTYNNAVYKNQSNLQDTVYPQLTAQVIGDPTLGIFQSSSPQIILVDINESIKILRFDNPDKDRFVILRSKDKYTGYEWHSSTTNSSVKVIGSGYEYFLIRKVIQRRMNGLTYYTLDRGKLVRVPGPKPIPTPIPIDQ